MAGKIGARGARWWGWRVPAVLAALALAGCSQSMPGVADTRLASDPNNQVARNDGIPVPVCAAVVVDQALSSLPMDEDARNGLSGLLADRLREAAQGRSDAGGHSFHSDPEGRIPGCRDARSIRVSLAYALDHERRPFVVTQVVTIAGHATRETFVRDIEGERNAGRLRFLAIDDPMQTAINDDIAARAAGISASFLTGK